MENKHRLKYALKYNYISWSDVISVTETYIGMVEALENERKKRAGLYN